MGIKTLSDYALHGLPAAAAVLPAWGRAFGISYRLNGSEKVILTFDDGPHPQGTQAVLEELAREEAKATFFLVGEQVERYPSLAAEIAAAGHEIALHCHRHRNLLRLTPGQVRDDLDRATEAIVNATGRLPVLYRPPYGIFSAASLKIARERDLQPLLWTKWGCDWSARATPQSIAALATRGISAGDVILLHDSDSYSSTGSWRNTAEAVPIILKTISRCHSCIL